MSSYAAKYSVKNYATWSAAMLVGIAVYTSQVEGIEQAQSRKTANGHIQVDTAGRTSDGVEVRAVPKASFVTNSEKLKSASLKFTQEIASSQESLGYDFAKVLDDNFLDLLL